MVGYSPKLPQGMGNTCCHKGKVVDYDDEDCDVLFLGLEVCVLREDKLEPLLRVRFLHAFHNLSFSLHTGCW